MSVLWCCLTSSSMPLLTLSTTRHFCMCSAVALELLIWLSTGAHRIWASEHRLSMLVLSNPAPTGPTPWTAVYLRDQSWGLWSSSATSKSQLTWSASDLDITCLLTTRSWSAPPTFPMCHPPLTVYSNANLPSVTGALLDDLSFKDWVHMARDTCHWRRLQPTTCRYKVAVTSSHKECCA